MNKLIYDKWTFTDDTLKAGNYYLETSLPSSSLGINTLEVTVVCADPAITDFSKNATLTYFHKDGQRGIYYLQSVDRIGPDRYTLKAISTLGLLSRMAHPGGIYTGQTVAEVVPDICGSIPVIIKSSLQKIKLYGWLPYVKPDKSSAKDNLSQVLFAIGAAVTNDLNGALRIEPLWSGVSAVFDDDHVCRKGKVTTEDPVTAVSVTEHHYFEGGETKELFNGTTQDGDVITFDAPYYNLTADGFAVLESGANYAVVSAGSGTLTGTAYVHNTRQVTVAVQSAPVDNIKTPTENATLVSLVNSLAVAQRMAAYYKCRETIKVPVISDTARPGSVVSIYHPYDKQMVTACLSSADTTMSAVLKSKVEALVGFDPPNIEEQEYFDLREVLTGEGTWYKPSGAQIGRIIMISGGSGGENGAAGVSSVTAAKSSSSLPFTVTPEGPGSGGKGGAGGSGGKILELSAADIGDATEIEYSCGAGGGQGEEGGETTFGDFTTESGTRASTGYVDPVTGEVFAKPGDDGIDGGDGGDRGNYGKSVNGNLGGSPGESGSTNVSDKNSAGQTLATSKLTWTASGGGGASNQANGSDGAVSASGHMGCGNKNNVLSALWYVYPSKGGEGAAGGNGSDAENYGCGGGGGHGGGGAGACGTVTAGTVTPASGYTIGSGRAEFNGRWIYGGDGGTGGKGKEGCIIVFYKIPKEVKYGAPMDKQGRFAIDRAGRLMVV